MACKLEVNNPIITIILVKPDKEIKFVFDGKSVKDFIYLDDTLNTIKKKIFRYVSIPDKGYYIREDYQQLWVQPSNGIYRIIDFKYYDKQTNTELDVMLPAIYSEFAPDNKFVNAEGVRQYKYINQNNMILYDLIDLTNRHEYTLYVCNLADIAKEINTDDEQIRASFIDKYFPQADLKVKETDTKRDFKSISEQLEKERAIVKMLTAVANAKSENVKDCKINHFFLEVNNANIEPVINLLKIFNYLRENLLSIELPFVKYKDPDWEYPYSSLYKPMIDDGIIDEKILVEKWLYNIKKDKITGKMLPIKELAKGVIIRIQTYEYQGLPHYGIIQIYNTGKISFIVNFEEGYEAGLGDIEKCIKKLAELIEKINRIEYRIDKSVDFAIEPPRVLKADKNIILSANATFRYIKSDARFDTTRPIDYKELYELSRIFTNYVSQRTIDTRLADKRFAINYNRVSNFKNISYILSFIEEQIQYGKSEYDIIIDLMEQFGKSKEDANELMNEYARTLGQQYYKSSTTTIEINGQTNMLRINGSTSMFQLIRATNFTIAFIQIYDSLKKYKKDYRDIFRPIRGIEREETVIEPEDELKIDEFTNMNSNGVANIDYDINVNKYLQDIDFVVPQKKKDSKKEGKKEKHAKEGSEEGEEGEEDESIESEGRNVEYDSAVKGLAQDSEIDLNIKLKCDDPIPELDTCKDLCNDRSYNLRRLQRHDPKLFRYKLSKMKDKTYASKCQGTDDRQPVVMRTNPDKHPLVDRESYTYAIRYGSSKDNLNYYICPKAWCPYHQIPILYKKIKDIKVRQTIEGPCTVGKCPFGDHEVMINTKSLFSNPKFDEHGLYPGFTKGKHPDGYCLPCCYGKPQNDATSSIYSEYMKCLGEETEEVKKEESFRYILGYTNILSEGRFGLLPILVAKVLGNSKAIEPGFIKKSGYYRRGIKQTRGESLLSAVAECVSDNKDNPLSVEELKKHLIAVITPELFRTLNNGILEIIFKNDEKSSIEAYKDYIRTGNISLLYVWDLISRRDILYPEGTNLVVFTEDSIICPVGLHVGEFYSPEKRTIMLVRIADYYEPVYYLKFDDGDITVQWFYTYNTNLFEIINTNCAEKEALDWREITGISETPELTLRQTLDKIGSGTNTDIKQIIDYYNKVVAILLPNGGYIAVKPSGILEGYDVLKIDEVKLKTYPEMKSLLEMLAKKGLPTKPIAKVLNADGIVAGIKIETGRIIPVKAMVLTKADNLQIMEDEAYYPDVDKKIRNRNKTANEQISRVGKIRFEMESYERLRFEISKYLQKHKAILEEIRKIVALKSPSAEKKTRLSPIISHLFKTLVITERKDSASSAFDLNSYDTPNIRYSCFNMPQAKCKNDYHCVATSGGGGCKLYISKWNLINGKDNIEIYKLRIIEELLRNKMKRDEILSDNVPEIINKGKIDEYHYEISFFNKSDSIFDKVRKLYAKEQQIHLEEIDTFDISDEKFYGIDKDTIQKYASTDERSDLEPLSPHWAEYFGNEFKVDRTGSLFKSVAKVLNMNKNSVEQRYNVNRIKTDIIKFEPSAEFLAMLGLPADANVVAIYKADTMSQLEQMIYSDEYLGREIDIKVMAELYDLTFAVVDKKLTKESPAAGIQIIKGVRDYQKDGYVFLYYHNKKDIDIYDILTKQKKYKFDWDAIPEPVQQLISPLLVQMPQLVNQSKRKHIIIRSKKKPAKKIRIKIKKRHR